MVLVVVVAVVVLVVVVVRRWWWWCGGGEGMRARALEGHWRTNFEGIGGALVGIGGHWWSSAGIGFSPVAHCSVDPAWKEYAFGPTRAAVSEK